MLSELDALPSVQLGDYVLRFELDDLTPFSQEVAFKELRETKENRENGIKELRNLLQQETDLTVPLENDDWLIRFLRPTKFYPESAFELIKRYYSFKIKYYDIYNGLTPSKEENVFKGNILSVFPNRDQMQRRILLLELGKKWHHKEVTLDEVYKGVVLFLEAAMLEPETQVNGAVVIFDMDGLSLQQAWQFTPAFAKRIIDWLQDSVPLRLKAIHIVNQPKIFNMVFALFKPFFNEKLRSRIYFHGTDRDSLHKHISQKCLPKEYDGTIDIPRVSGNEWYGLLLKCDEEYLALNKYGYNKEKEAKERKKNKSK